MKAIAIIYILCLIPAIALTNITYENCHKGQHPIIVTFFKVWIIMPFYIMKVIYEAIVKNKD